jgi:hypothetical protein
MFCINNKKICHNYNLSEDGDPRWGFIPAGTGDGEEMLPARVHRDPRRDFFCRGDGYGEPKPDGAYSRLAGDQPITRDPSYDSSEATLRWETQLWLARGQAQTICIFPIRLRAFQTTLQEIPASASHSNS